MPERKDGRIVRRHGKIVFTRARRCVKVHTTKTPTPIPPQPIPGGSGTPVATPPAGTTITTSTSTTPTQPPPPPAKDNPCSTPMPGNSLQLGRTYTLAGEDTFTKDAPLGSFAQVANVPDATSLPVVYTGDHGMGWTSYADGWPSTYTQPPYVPTSYPGYQSSTVVSVHDGMLDFYLHDDPATGYAVGASLSPLPGGNRYQTYGAYSFCEKVVPTVGSDLADFYEASLLWPQDDGDYQCAESDFPETYDPVNDPLTNQTLNGGSLDNQEIYAFAHYSTWSAQSGCQPNPPPPDSWNTPIDLSQWHVFTQEWGPGYRSYYIDGQYVYTSTNEVWSQPERWQLQMEPSPLAHLQNDGGTGHVYIAWVWIGKPDY